MAVTVQAAVHARAKRDADGSWISHRTHVSAPAHIFHSRDPHANANADLTGKQPSASR